MNDVRTWMMSALLVMCVVSPGRAQGNDAKVLRFSFGTPTSVTRAGVAKVTIKDTFTPERGYGFASTDKLLAFDRGGWRIERPKDEYTASVYGAYRTTSDLTCALIEGPTAPSPHPLRAGSATDWPRF